MVNEKKAKVRGKTLWVVYISAAVAGLILLGDAIAYAPLQKLTARLGIALLFLAVALIAANGRVAGYIAAAILWLAVVVTFLV